MRPFEGIRVLDFTHVLAGPFATYQLAVMGADVVAARVRRLDEALASDQAGSRRVVQPVPEAPGKPRGLKGPVAAFAFAHDGPQVTRPAPFHGEHTAEVLAEMGIGAEAFQKLKGAGGVGRAATLPRPA